MSAATGQGRPLRVMPGTTSPRNGLPPVTGYVYRGSGRDELTGHLTSQRIKFDIEHDVASSVAVPARPAAVPRRPAPSSPRSRPPEAPPGPGAREVQEPPAVVVQEPPAPVPVALPEPPAVAVKRCKGCGYMETAPGHKVICGEPS